MISFVALKHVMVQAPVLCCSGFTKGFVVETNACDSGVNTVLMQEEHLVAFYSSKIQGKWILASTYSKELLAITLAIPKWCHYLLSHHFTIRTYHACLKNLLTKVIQTPQQQKFLQKLCGFDFNIIYKLGKQNRAHYLERMHCLERMGKCWKHQRAHYYHYRCYFLV